MNDQNWKQYMLIMLESSQCGVSHVVCEPCPTSSDCLLSSGSGGRGGWCTGSELAWRICWLNSSCCCSNSFCRTSCMFSSFFSCSVFWIVSDIWCRCFIMLGSLRRLWTFLRTKEQASSYYILAVHSVNYQPQVRSVKHTLGWLL